jgi:hypothetical protein
MLAERALRRRHRRSLRSTRGRSGGISRIRPGNVLCTRPLDDQDARAGVTMSGIEDAPICVDVPTSHRSASRV